MNPTLKYLLLSILFLDILIAGCKKEEEENSNGDTTKELASATT
jgi:hypothetical protein